VEASHDLKFRRTVEVVVCASDAEYERLAGTRSRFCVLPLYGRLFVSKRAQQDAQAGTIHLDIYVRHELSHALLFQNMSLLSALRCPDWLLEGLAVFHAGQRGTDGYCSKQDVCEKMRQGYFLSPSDFVMKPWKTTNALKTFPMPDKYWFLYAEMACLVEDLIQTRGKEKFRAFLDGLMNGENALTRFANVYGQPFDTYVEAFRNRMLNTKDK
jgi:hypothetical protein